MSTLFGGSKLARSRWAPWAGLAAAALAVGGNHQLMADSIYFNCSSGNPLSVSASCLVALVIAGMGGALSWAGREDGETEGPEPGNRRFLALLSVMAAALAGFAIVLQLLVGLIEPTCFR